MVPKYGCIIVNVDNDVDENSGLVIGRFIDEGTDLVHVEYCNVTSEEVNDGGAAADFGGLTTDNNNFEDAAFAAWEEGAKSLEEVTEDTDDISMEKGNIVCSIKECRYGFDLENCIVSIEVVASFNFKVDVGVNDGMGLRADNRSMEEINEENEICALVYEDVINGHIGNDVRGLWNDDDDEDSSEDSSDHGAKMVEESLVGMYGIDEDNNVFCSTEVVGDVSGVADMTDSCVERKSDDEGCDVVLNEDNNTTVEEVDDETDDTGDAEWVDIICLVEASGIGE